ncbi:MAG TPA: hypothetical protein DCK95_10660 [Anaerolineaceae bacterium]|uniref:Regulatory protein RecX n=1 Tax=Anaerolinea thermophila TaxID=167964 RepID=A0A101FZ68_9CHLR|nr:MAG: Regulatory protein RecX [Anaerolinea thermophila]HAF62769.1 hypothetical protein [Anaerolineaceae bacterium]
MQRVITDIEQQKKNPNRVNIFLDEEFAFGLHKFVALGLKIGDAMDEAQILQLQTEDSIEEAYQRGLRLLSFRARSEHEMRTRLMGYGCDEGVIEQVVARLTDKGYLNDQQFAADWVENRITFRPRGRKLLRMELQQKKLNEEQIESAFKDLPDEVEIARQAAMKYSVKLKGLDEQTFKKRLYGFLVRRGFHYEDFKPIMEEMWEELNSSNLLEKEVKNDGR